MQCNKCNIEKDLEEFQRDSARPNGRRNPCKECYKKNTYKRRKYARTPKKPAPKIEEPIVEPKTLLELLKGKNWTIVGNSECDYIYLRSSHPRISIEAKDFEGLQLALNLS